MGGRAAEKLVLNEISTGASNDIEVATGIAKDMLTVYGMSEKLGNLAYGKSEDHVFMGRDFGHTRDYSEEIAAEIDNEVQRIVNEQYEIAKTLLTQNQDMLEQISKALLERETLDEKEFDELMEKIKDERNLYM